MNNLYHKIIIKKANQLDKTGKITIKEEIDKWTSNEWLNGWIIEILNFYFYYIDLDLDIYCDIEYRVKQDPIHLQIEERLKIGL